MNPTLSQSPSAALQRLYREGCHKRDQPKSNGATYCECGRERVKTPTSGRRRVCLYCQQCDDVARELGRRSAETCDNEVSFNPTPSPLAEAWRWVTRSGHSENRRAV